MEDLFIVELDADNRLNIVDQAGNTTGMTVSEPAVHEVTTVTEFQNSDSQAPTLEDIAVDGTDMAAPPSE